MYPASRGSSHAQSRDPEAAQRVDLGFLTNPADLDVLATVVMVADNIFQSPRMKGQVLARVQPPPEVNLQDVEQAREYVRDRLMSYHHALEHVLWPKSVMLCSARYMRSRKRLLT
ncbi:hypothetical protein AnigIFM63604_007373 [Aspergillus niger]|uniref:Glucose-methanol-choline oxidoreductase C-terminal domain-containing protein n=1 Tax=Aspergillus niger TaxID=5061 RepID=A0A9W6A559_ASPNG|nr:hypothetical protein AnigIFM63604_007373 [Aspergillus niger]